MQFYIVSYSGLRLYFIIIIIIEKHEFTKEIDDKL